MKFIETKLAGAYIIELDKIGDERGFFSRLWCRKTMEEKGLKSNIAQINTSHNVHKGTLRGLHYQQAPYEEVKIVQCIRGAIFDVAVDIRPKSPTYMQWFGIELDEDCCKLLYIPEGFAHGYQTVKDNSAIIYPTSEFYTPESEGGIRWDEPEIAIKWPLDPVNMSKKDLSWPLNDT
jgi:dTDP-4-dehydrorhamnose 3,5-epimerase